MKDEAHYITENSLSVCIEHVMLNHSCTLANIILPKVCQQLNSRCLEVLPSSGEEGLSHDKHTEI